MATSAHPLQDSFATYSPSPHRSGPILVATDTSSQSDAAFPLALTLAQRANTTVQLVSAMRPFAMPMYPFDAMPVVVETDGAIRGAREALVLAQRDRLVSAAATWPVSVRTGDPAREIVEFAREIDASVLIVGRGRHAALQRALGGETVLRLLQLGDTPVLAAESRLASPPKRVVIATDFSEFSLYAAQAALPLLAADATVTLVHVAPAFAETDAILLDRAIAYRNQAMHGFTQLHERLGREGLTFDDVYTTGNPSDEIMKVIRAKEADLVVTATHGYGFLRRMILGSVAAELVRHAPCSVLCVPGSAHTLLTARARPTTTSRTHTLDLSVLDAELSAFGERNAGRSCTVEIDQRSLGAQILGHGLRVVAATHDHTSGIVSLMFGASTLVGEHLSHAVPEVTSAAISADGDGRDQVLRLSHGDGQTLVLLD